MAKTKNFFILSVLILTTLACNALLPLSESISAPTPAAEPSSDEGLPLNEDSVPRVSVEDAKAAFDSGAAIIVDVRSAQAFANSHIPGALNIPLGEFETNPTQLDLPRDEWIITYCT